MSATSGKPEIAHRFPLEPLVQGQRLTTVGAEDTFLFLYINMSKATTQQLRRTIRQQRRSLDDRSRAMASLQLTQHILANRHFRASKRIACYLPNDGEIDLTPLIEHLWYLGKYCYLPVLSPLGHNRLEFAPFTDSTALKLNCFGIAEPDVHARSWLSPMQLDLVITPLVAFDSKGNRLGMGGGYYDRSFAFLRHRQHWKKPRLVGVAYDFQQVTTLPVKKHDVPLGCVITDTGLI